MPLTSGLVNVYTGKQPSACGQAVMSKILSDAMDHSEEYRLLPGIQRHPRIDLGPIRSPVLPLPRLGADLGIDLFLKRDDARPLGMGGNKVRQLEFYLGPARIQGADTILITGAIQSNFVCLCAAAARRHGWEPVVQLEDRVPENNPVYKTSGNVLLNNLFGAEIHYFAEGEDEAAADASLEKLAESLISDGKNPYVIHLGTDYPPLGALGYALASAETRLQLSQIGIDPDHIVVPSGSGLTHSGFLCGATAINWTVPVHGICVRRRAELQRRRIKQRSREVSELLGLTPPVPESNILVHDQVLAPGYGQLNSQISDAINRAAHLEGLLVDPVYSGRCLAGLINLVERGIIKRGEQVLFLHTGGLPAIFAYQKILQL